MNEWREQRNVLLRAALSRLVEPAPSSEKARILEWLSERIGPETAGSIHAADGYNEECVRWRDLLALLASTAPEAPKEERNIIATDHGRQFGAAHWYTFSCPWCERQIIRQRSEQICEHCQKPIRWKSESKRSAT